MAVAELDVTAQKTEPKTASEDHVAETGKLRMVQVRPSGEVAASAVSVARVAQTVPFHASVCHFAPIKTVGKDVCAVHVTPVGEVAQATAPELATAQKTVPFQAAEHQPEAAGIVFCTQLVPVVDVAVKVVPLENAQKVVPFVETYQFPLDGIVPAVQVVPLVDICAV
jgi:hypothetical protein